LIWPKSLARSWQHRFYDVLRKTGWYREERRRTCTVRFQEQGNRIERYAIHKCMYEQYITEQSGSKNKGT
jgi:hypothetical protein